MRRRSLVGLAIASLSALAHSDEPATPTTLKGGKVITVDEAAALSKGKGSVFVDTRSLVNFGKVHILAAVLAIKQGYGNVSYFRGGFNDWSAKGLPVER